MWIYLIQGIGYGLAAASQPGPFQTYIISQTLTRGWKRTLPAALAPLVSDGPIILICVLLLSQVPAWMQRFLHLASGLFILYLVYGTFKSWKNFDSQLPTTETGTQQSIFKAALMNALNPNPYIFWTLVTGPILLKGWHENSHPRPWVSDRVLCNPHLESGCHHHRLWHSRAAGTKSKSRIIGHICDCIILFWVVSIVVGGWKLKK